jgi:outer membrane lipoprotein carrier protein LolA
MARAPERLLFLGLLGWALAASAAGPWTLDRLMQGLAQTRSARASFVEKKTVRLLERPLVASGELSFAAPDKLEKRTLRPRPELLRLEGETLTLERAGRSTVLDLRSYPEVATFAESIRGTLAGDRAALERVYRLTLEGTEASWVLTLVPGDPAMRALVERIRIAGRRADLTVIEIQQANGDSSLMSVQRLPAP